MPHILIIDDHPITIRGYKLILENQKIALSNEVQGATNCDQVIEIMNVPEELFFDVVLLDISLPASKDKQVTSGEDLGFLIRKKYPKTKIIVHTGLNYVQRISNIFNTLKPEGFLIKSDISANVLKIAVNKVLQNGTYYSEKIKDLLYPEDFEKIYIDSSNRKILYHLSQGYRMKDLPEHIQLSMPTIERRKKRIKALLGVPNGNTKDLLEVARKKGFI
ncbi:response regulator [Flagellimonas sp. CMM7]|uniref:DNA-binding response regulator n=1 Tax=Flagellimonas sp. CMM7 TaxID=2654676 RepID=UPI0013D117AC|nr:response regulator [Flagellimonas sp. CMM7]UII80105.1 response regulator [Flagellimonas sp. CMM7]